MDKTLEEFRLRIAHAQIDSEQIEQDLWEARQRIAELEAEVARLREAAGDALATIELLDLGEIDDPIVYELVVNTRILLHAALERAP